MSCRGIKVFEGSSEEAVDFLKEWEKKHKKSLLDGIDIKEILGGRT